MLLTLTQTLVDWFIVWARTVADLATDSATYEIIGAMGGP